MTPLKDFLDHPATSDLSEQPVAWLRDAHEGAGDECLVPAAKGDPGAFPVYLKPSQDALAPTARPATSATSEGEAWASLETAPMDGRPFYVRAQSPFRFLPYKPASQEAKRGKAGRWQTMNEYGGWENCSPPVGDWRLHPDHAAALASPPVSERERELEGALRRQADNMAFVLNHASLYAWHDKFVVELEEDRAFLTAQPAGEGK